MCDCCRNFCFTAQFQLLQRQLFIIFYLYLAKHNIISTCMHYALLDKNVFAFHKYFALDLDSSLTFLTCRFHHKSIVVVPKLQKDFGTPLSYNSCVTFLQNQVGNSPISFLTSSTRSFKTT